MKETTISNCSGIRAHSRGIGLLELMLALLVIAALLFMATRYYRVTRASLQVTQAMEMIHTVTDASYKWAENATDFSQISLPALVAAGLLPDQFSENDANPWKGSVDVESAEGGYKVRISLTDVPIPACQRLATKVDSISQDHVPVDPCGSTFWVEFEKP